MCERSGTRQKLLDRLLSMRRQIAEVERKLAYSNGQIDHANQMCSDIFGADPPEEAKSELYQLLNSAEQLATRARDECPPGVGWKLFDDLLREVICEGLRYGR